MASLQILLYHWKIEVYSMSWLVCKSCYIIGKLSNMTRYLKYETNYKQYENTDIPNPLQRLRPSRRAGHACIACN
jgi:hypothetical protein